MDNLSGSVERITYYNPENGYSVLRLRPEKRGLPGLSQEGLITVTGNLPELTPGEHLRLEGRWVTHPKHGLQFQAENCQQILPATVGGIRRYLGSGLIKGIGPRLAERIVGHFGEETLEVIENHPERLSAVPDIGPKRSQSIAAAWEEQKQVKEIMLFLHSYGVSTNLAVKIFKQYGDQALQVVNSDPYRLARDIFGVGFKTADRIAQALGLPIDHPTRIEAGIVFTLNEMINEGHVYAPREMLIEKSSALLGVTAQLVPPALDRLAGQDRIRLEILPFDEQIGDGSQQDGLMLSLGDSHGTYGQSAIYLTPFYHGETGVAQRLHMLMENRADEGHYSVALPLMPMLADDQLSAIRTALSHPVSVLTGGPGTGKTTAIKALIAAMESARRRYALASPTGRAAKRLSEAAGRPASTIHRLLNFSPGEGFKYNADNPLPVDVMVVDESSMLDLLLAHHLLKAIQSGTHLLLVGDVDQLPSVGAGDVLRDIIASQSAPVTRLKTIFRQAAGSFIITNAHRINQGLMPLFPTADEQEGGSSQGDFFLFPAESPEQAADWVQEVVCERIPHKFGLHPRDQVQVLAPMYRGPAGVNALNNRLQALLNPPDRNKPEKTLFGQTFRVGDKIMQTQNNYDKDVYNGDIGFIAGLDLLEHTLRVNFEDRLVNYDWSEADQLALAYTISVHKSQGSEFPAVVIPLVTSHYLMLQRNLLYTAVTRARQLCVLVGSRRAIGMAVRNDKVAHRYTALDRRLRNQQLR